MPGYHYQAIDAEGQARKGVVDADTPRLARAALRAQHLIPLSVTPVSPAPGSTVPARAAEGRVGAAGAATPAGASAAKSLASTPLAPTLASAQMPPGLAAAADPAASSSHAALRRRTRRWPVAARALWVRQLAELTAAGLTLERALACLQEEAGSPREQALSAALRQAVQGGASLAAALDEQGDLFTGAEVACIRAGEQSGQLDAVLRRLADDLEQAQALQGKVLSASLYPAVVAGVAILIVGFLLAYVVPQMAQVFAGQKQALPLLTRIMLATSDALRAAGPWLALLLVAGVVGAPVLMRRPAVRIRVDALVLRLPLFGRLLRHHHAARFASTLSLLLQSGVPAVRALGSAADTLDNQFLRQLAQQAALRVREGATLAGALGAQRQWPGTLLTFVALGEQTGQLSTLLSRSARQLRDDVQRRTLQIASLIEPALVLLMGGFVMIIVLAVLLPIIQVNLLVR